MAKPGFPALAQRLQPGIPLPEQEGEMIDEPLALQLFEHVRSQQPSFIIEAGSGLSTLAMAYALQQNRSGKLWSLEHLSFYRARHLRWLHKHGLTQQAEIFFSPMRAYEGKNTQLWYVLPAVLFQSSTPKIDFVFVDGPPRIPSPHARWHALARLWPFFAEGAQLWLNHASKAEEQLIIKYWQAEFPITVTPLDSGCDCAVIRPQRA